MTTTRLFGRAMRLLSAPATPPAVAQRRLIAWLLRDVARRIESGEPMPRVRLTRGGDS